MPDNPMNDRLELVNSPIDFDGLVRFVRAEKDGAIVTFDGFVRNESHGRTTEYLEYEAYEAMADSKNAGNRGRIFMKNSRFTALQSCTDWAGSKSARRASLSLSALLTVRRHSTHAGMQSIL